MSDVVILKTMHSKIKSQPALVKIVKNLKRRGKKIVCFSGSFDILHVGHIKSLEEAKKQGDVLTILLNSDKSVRGYKGPKRPINSQKERAETLAALECVDYIVIFNELNAKKILNKIRPHILCNGADWGKYFTERKMVEDYGGKIHITKWTKHFSTSNLIKKIFEVYSRPAAKAIFINLGTSDVPNTNVNVKTPDVLNINKKSKKIFKKLSKSYKILLVNKRHYSDLEKIILQIAKKSGISLNDSWVITDKEKDVIMVKEINAKVIKIGDKLSKNLKLEPDYYATRLKKAVEIIMQQSKIK